MKLRRGGGSRGEWKGERCWTHRANTSQDCRLCVATSPPPFPPHKEILTFPEIRNLPEGRGLIPSTCHVPQPRCWILVKQISLSLMRIVLFFNSLVGKKKKKIGKNSSLVFIRFVYDPCIWIEAL